MSKILDKSIEILDHKGVIRIAPCKSTVLPGGSAVLSDSKATFYVLSSKQVPPIDILLKEYPNIAERFVKPSTVLKDKFLMNEEALKRYFFTIPASGRTLDLANEEERFIAYLLKSFPEFGDTEFQRSTVQKFYVVDEEAKAKESNKKSKAKIDALAKFYSLSTDEKMQIASYFGKATKNVSAERLDFTVFDIIEQDPLKFMAVFTDDRKFSAQANINRLLERKTLSKKGASIYHGDNRIGATMADALEYFMDSDNSLFVAQLLKGLTE